MVWIRMGKSGKNMINARGNVIGQSTTYHYFNDTKGKYKPKYRNKYVKYLRYYN